MQILCSDLDGTLFNQGVIKEETLKKIYSFKNKGNKFIIATGRPVSSMEHLIYSTNFDYAICCNGGIIVDNKFNIIKKEIISMEDIKIIMQHIPENYSIYVSDGFKIEKIEKYEDITIIDIVFFSITDKNKSIWRANKLKEVLDKENLNISLVINRYYVDIMGCNVSKGNALEYVEKTFYPENEGILVTGDQLNDVSMFLKYKNSYALSHGHENLKEIANNIIEDVGDIIEDDKFILSCK